MSRNPANVGATGCATPTSFAGYLRFPRLGNQRSARVVQITAIESAIARQMILACISTSALTIVRFMICSWMPIKNAAARIQAIDADQKCGSV
jgi:hypothetical protein